MDDSHTNDVKELYRQLMATWNERNASGMAELFTADGEMIGYDGSLAMGREDIFSHLAPIFEMHPTASFVYKVKEVRFLGTYVVLLRAIAGMVPPGQTEINSNVNAHHTIIAIKEKQQWTIQLFQNTPAQFHGSPELVEKMTAELREVQFSELHK